MWHEGLRRSADVMLEAGEELEPFAFVLTPSGRLAIVPLGHLPPPHQAQAVAAVAKKLSSRRVAVISSAWESRDASYAKAADDPHHKHIAFIAVFEDGDIKAWSREYDITSTERVVDLKAWVPFEGEISVRFFEGLR